MKKQLVIAAALAFLLLFNNHALAKCHADRFYISNFTLKISDPFLVLLGHVKNANDEDCAVELQGEIYDQSGALIDTYSFWPAEVENIKSGSVFTFKYVADIPCDQCSAKIYVLRAQKW